MAKDRDRRYQTPEQLVRDLLTVAGALGLRSVSPEGLVWLSADAAAGLGAAPGLGRPRAGLRGDRLRPGLVGPGRRGPAPSTGADGRPARAPSGVRERSDPPGRDRARPPAVAAVEPDPRRAPADAGDRPRPRARSPSTSNDDLLAVAASAPPRSVIVLTDDGPYDLGVGRGGRPSPTGWRAAT